MPEPHVTQEATANEWTLIYAASTPTTPGMWLLDSASARQRGDPGERVVVARPSDTLAALESEEAVEAYGRGVWPNHWPTVPNVAGEREAIRAGLRALRVHLSEFGGSG